MLVYRTVHTESGNRLSYLILNRGTIMDNHRAIYMVMLDLLVRLLR